MRWLFALLALAASCSPALAQGPIVGPGQPILCANNANNPNFGAPAQAAIVTATTTLLIANTNASARIYICGWHATSTQTTTSTFQFISGTGATCGTNTTNLTPAFNVTSTAPSADHIDYATIQNVIGQQVCVISTGATVGLAIAVYYSIF